MSKSSIRTGSLTLLLLITTVALAALGLLSYQTAHANLTRTNAYIDGTEAYYQNDSAGQELVATLDNALRNGEDPKVALPEACEVDSGHVRVYLVNGKPVSPAAVNTEPSSLGKTGLSASGLSSSDADADDAGKPALAITIAYGNGTYDVQSWDQVRVYE